MGHWCAGVSTTAPAPLASSAGTSTPWSSTGTGTALGAPLAGRLIDSRGAPAGYLFAFAAGLAAVLLAVPCRRALGTTRPACGPPRRSS